MQGADVSFQIRGGAGAAIAQDALLTVYTTRPDTVRTRLTHLSTPGDAHHRREHPLLVACVLLPWLPDGKPRLLTQICRHDTADLELWQAWRNRAKLLRVLTAVGVGCRYLG